MEKVMLFLFCICMAVLGSLGLRVPGAKLETVDEAPEPPPMPGDAPPMEFGGRDGKQDHWPGYGGYGKGHGRGCTDKRAPEYCIRALKRGECYKSRKRNGCQKTCGVCKPDECKDMNFNCNLAAQSDLFCANSWFANGCKKSCNLCPEETTTTATTIATTSTTKATTASTTPATTSSATTTSTPVQACEDISSHCTNANSFSCEIFFFVTACMKSCGKCSEATTAETTTTTQGTTTTAATTTTTTTPPTTEPTEGSSTTTIARTTAGKVCKDKNEKHCALWAKAGFCDDEDYIDTMMEDCPVACEMCIFDF